MKALFKQVSKEDFSKDDSLCIALLAHSDKDVVFGVDRKSYKLDKIEDLVCSNPTLAGKPVIFIVSSFGGIQTCLRGCS